MKIVTASARGFYLFYRLMQTMLFINLFIEFLSFGVGIATKLSHFIVESMFSLLSYLRSKPILTAFYQSVSQIHSLVPALLVVSLGLAGIALWFEGVKHVHREYYRIRDWPAHSVYLLCLAGTVLAGALCMVIAPSLSLIISTPIQTVFVISSFFGLGFALNFIKECGSGVKNTWQQLYNQPKRIFRFFSFTNLWKFKIKWVFSTALLAHVTFLVITSSGLSGFNQAMWMAFNIMGSVSYQLENMVLMLNYAKKEAAVFYEDLFAKMGAFSLVFAASSYGTVPAFAAMQFLYAIPKLKKDFAYPRVRDGHKYSEEGYDSGSESEEGYGYGKGI